MRLADLDVLALPATATPAPTIAPSRRRRLQPQQPLDAAQHLVGNLFDLCGLSLPMPDLQLPAGLMLLARHGQDRPPVGDRRRGRGGAGLKTRRPERRSGPGRGQAADAAFGAETPWPGSSARPGRTPPAPASAGAGRPGCTATVIRSRFSMPTPCSPVRQPPTSTHSLSMSSPAASAFSISPGVLMSNRISGAGCRRRVEDVGAAQAVGLGDLADALQHVGEPAGRDRAVHADVVGDPAGRPNADLRPFQIAALSASDCDNLQAGRRERRGDLADAGQHRVAFLVRALDLDDEHRLGVEG